VALNRRSPATLIFAGAVALSTIFLFVWLSKVTFWRDEWGFILDRRGSDLDTYLTPFVEQLLALAVALYKVLIAVFGIGSPLPFQIAHVIVLMATLVVLFVYLRRRVGEWLALGFVLPLLFFGPAWDDVLFPFQVSLIGSVGCGVGALLALDSEKPRGDIAATLLLIVGLFSQDAAIPFVAAATVDIALTRDRWRRAYVVVFPTALWLIWYAGWGQYAQNFISFHNFSTLPGYIADGLASSLASLVGLAIPRDEVSVLPLDWGRPLLVIVVAFGVWRVARVGVRAMPRRLWAVIVAQLGFWSLTGLNAAFFGQATSGRYQLVGAILWVMIFAELLRGVRVRTPVVAAVVAIGALAALANFSYLRDTAHGLSIIAEQQKGGLAALELTRDEVNPDFTLTEKNSGVDYLGIVDAGSYFSAIDAYGSPAYTPEELATAPEAARVSADTVFAAALRIGAQPVASSGGATCRPVDLGDGATAVADLGLSSVTVKAPAEAGVELRLHRYADEFPVKLGAVPPGQAVRVSIPQDDSQQPWQLQLSGSGTAQVCEASP
jgi:hypothetical protein